MRRTEWFKRTFPVIEDNGVLPAIIERLSGTPARAEELTTHADEATLSAKRNDKWSVKEQVGHLWDMEPLWLGRLEDLINGAAELRVADLTNQRTQNANHNATPLKDLLRAFREQRRLFVDKLQQLQDDQLENTALHPRLKTPMRIVDLAYFVAEHDDHHLAAAREQLKV